MPRFPRQPGLAGPVLFSFLHLSGKQPLTMSNKDYLRAVSRHWMKLLKHATQRDMQLQSAAMQNNFIKWCYCSESVHNVGYLLWSTDQVPVFAWEKTEHSSTGL